MRPCPSIKKINNQIIINNNFYLLDFLHKISITGIETISEIRQPCLFMNFSRTRMKNVRPY